MRKLSMFVLLVGWSVSAWAGSDQVKYPDVRGTWRGANMTKDWDFVVTQQGDALKLKGAPAGERGFACEGVGTVKTNGDISINIYFTRLPANVRLGPNVRTGRLSDTGLVIPFKVRWSGGGTDVLWIKVKDQFGRKIGKAK